MEKVRPAKKVEAALAVWPPRKLKTAEAVQLIMIKMINTISRGRKRAGVNMSESYTIVPPNGPPEQEQPYLCQAHGRGVNEMHRVHRLSPWPCAHYLPEG